VAILPALLVASVVIAIVLRSAQQDLNSDLKHGQLSFIEPEQK
jgi:hypothetical protein